MNEFWNETWQSVREVLLGLPLATMLAIGFFIIHDLIFPKKPILLLKKNKQADHSDQTEHDSTE